MRHFTSPALLFLALLAAAPNAHAAETPSLVFIANADCPVSKLSTNDLASYFFKKKHDWPDETKVRFIDQKDSTASKKLFNLKVLKKSVREIDLYWIGEKNFSGQSAPLQAPTDEMVLSLVESLPGSIGYVSSDSELDLSKVKQITLQGLE